MKHVFSLFCLFTFLISPRLYAQTSDLEKFALKRQQVGAKFEKKRTINIYRILFPVNSAALSPKDKDFLQSELFPYILRFPPTALITVEGHTDSDGSAELNKALSKARADSVKQFLIVQGIAPLRLASVGYGESFPISKDKSRNRRVTMTIEQTISDATIFTSDGKSVVAKYIQYENDGTVSYTTSDTDPVTRLPQGQIKYVKYADGTTYDPNNQLAGTIRLKNGREIKARMISQEPGFVSYKTSETAPLVKLKSSEVSSIRYADGNEVFMKDTKPVVKGIGKGAIGFRTGGEIEVFNPEKGDDFVAYQLQEDGAVTKIKQSKVQYIKYPDGRIENITATATIANNLNLKWLNTLVNLTRLSVFADFGVVPLMVKKSAIDFTYVDESPSKDNMRTQIDLDKRFIAYGGQFGLEWETDHTLTWRTYYQYALNSEGSTKVFGVGLGKIIGTKKNTRIGADLQFGSASVKLGQLVQNDLFIQVNEARFYSNEVKMRYRNYFVAINPYVSYEKPLQNGFSLRFNIGAAAGLHTKSAVTFRGKDEQGKKEKGKEKLTAPNLSFKLDGANTTTAKLFSILGPQVKVGLYYTIFTRDN